MASVNLVGEGSPSLNTRKDEPVRSHKWCLYHHSSDHEMSPQCHEASEKERMQKAHGIVDDHYGWLNFKANESVSESDVFGLHTVTAPGDTPRDIRDFPRNIVTWLDRIALLRKKTVPYAALWVKERDNSLVQLRASLVLQVSNQDLAQWDRYMAESCYIVEKFIREINSSCKESTSIAIGMAKTNWRTPALWTIPDQAEGVVVLQLLSQSRFHHNPSLDTPIKNKRGMLRDSNTYVAKLDERLHVTFRNYCTEVLRLVSEIKKVTSDDMIHKPELRRAYILLGGLVANIYTLAPFSWSVKFNWQENNLTALQRRLDLGLQIMVPDMTRSDSSIPNCGVQ